MAAFLYAKTRKRIQTAPPGEISATLSFIRGNQNHVHLSRKPESQAHAVAVASAGHCHHRCGRVDFRDGLGAGVGMAPLVGTVLYAFLSIQVDGSSILDFLRRAACFLFLQQQKYEWRLEP